MAQEEAQQNVENVEKQSEESTTSEQETPPVENTEQGEPEGEGAPPSETETRPKGRSAKGRISQLTREKKLLRAELEQLKGKQGAEDKPKGKPKEEDFDNYNEYVEALADHRYDTRKQQDEKDAIARKAQEYQFEIQQNFNVKAEVFAEANPDFDDIATTDEMLDIYETNPAFEEAVSISENAAELAYHLGKNPDKAREIAKMSPVQAAMAVARVESEITKSKPNNVSSAPIPIKPVGKVGSAGEKSYGDMSMDEYAAARKRAGA